MNKKEPNVVLLIFTIIGSLVLLYFFGRFVSNLTDKHNAEKNKQKKEKWFDK